MVCCIWDLSKKSYHWLHTPSAFAFCSKIAFHLLRLNGVLQRYKMLTQPPDCTIETFGSELNGFETIWTCLWRLTLNNKQYASICNYDHNVFWCENGPSLAALPALCPCSCCSPPYLLLAVWQVWKGLTRYDKVWLTMACQQKTQVQIHTDST